MKARAEITGRYARVLREGAEEGQGGGPSGEVCSVTGWSRDNARRRPVAAAKRPSGRRKPEPRTRARRYS